MKRVIKAGLIPDYIIQSTTNKVSAKNWFQLIEEFEDNYGLKVDSADKRSPNNFIYAYDDNGNEYEVEVTKYYNSDFEILKSDIHATGDRSMAPEFN